MAPGRKAGRCALWPVGAPAEHSADPCASPSSIVLWDASGLIMCADRSIKHDPRSIVRADRSTKCGACSIACVGGPIVCADRSIEPGARSIMCVGRSIVCAVRSIACAARSIMCAPR